MFNEFLEEVDRGLEGLNRGLNTGIPALDEYISGFQRKRYYLIGAHPGVGKTGFVDTSFVINPYNYLNKIIKKAESEKLTSVEESLASSKLKIFYFSLEIDRKSKIGKWCSYYLYRKYNLLISSEEIFSKKSTLSSEIYEKIKESREFFEPLLDIVLINDNSINPTGVYKRAEQYAKEHGSWVKEKKIDPHTKKEEEIDVFKYRDPSIWPVVIVDHIGLIRAEKDGKSGIVLSSKKARIDKLSEYAIQLRNDYGFTVVFVSQFNRDLADIQRQRFSSVKVQLEDFKDTGNPSEDANIVLGMFNPSRYNIDNYRNYEIRKTRGRFRSVDIIKNRDGPDDIAFATAFLGECGAFTQIPTSEKMRDEHYKQFFPPFKA